MAVKGQMAGGDSREKEVGDVPYPSGGQYLPIVFASLKLKGETGYKGPGQGSKVFH